MVTSTRPRNCEPNQSEADNCTPRPAKRRKLEVEQTYDSSLPGDLSIDDHNVGALTRRHDCPRRKKVIGNLATHHDWSTAGEERNHFLKSTRSYGPSAVSPTPTPPSLCPSRSSGSEDSCLQRDEQTGLPSISVVLDTVSTPTYDHVDSPRPLRLATGGKGDSYKEPGPENNIKKPTLKEFRPGPPGEASESREAGSVSDKGSARAEERPRHHTLRTEDCTNADTRSSPLVILGSSISPPRSPVWRPEFVYEDVIDPQFGAEVQFAYKMSKHREALRRYRYGADIADRWKRGSTPEEAREEWKLTAARHLAEAEEYTDSD